MLGRLKSINEQIAMICWEYVVIVNHLKRISRLENPERGQGCTYEYQWFVKIEQE